MPLTPEEITDAIAELQAADGRRRIGAAQAGRGFTNEWCFFFKPSTTGTVARPGLKNTVGLALDLFDRDGMAIIEAHAISPGYMSTHRLALRNYRELVELAMCASALPADNPVLRATPDVDRVLGAYEALAQLELDIPELDRIWYSAVHFRLGRAAIAAVVPVAGERVLLVNGFIPGQVNTYGQPGTVTVVLRLASDLSWSAARHRLLGATNPANAVPGSFRYELWARREEIGLPRVDFNWNGAHLSAGPLEAIYELQLLTSDDQANLRPLSDFSFGRRLLGSPALRENVDALIPHHIPGSAIEERTARLYVQAREATENLNEPEALTVLEKLMSSGGLTKMENNGRHPFSASDHAVRRSPAGRPL